MKQKNPKKLECERCGHHSATKGGMTNHMRWSHGNYLEERKVFPPMDPSPPSMVVPVRRQPEWASGIAVYHLLPALPEKLP